MERTLNIVPGEAPESDDEEAGCKAKIAPQQGTAIQGEAPESDSSSSDADEAEDVKKEGDSIGTISSATSALSLLSFDAERNKTVKDTCREDKKKTSLLHKKLWERNASLRRSVDDFVYHTVEAATRDLNSIDQQLLRSQVTLQEAATSLKFLQSNLSHIHSKLSLITTSMYLPVINSNDL